MVYLFSPVKQSPDTNSPSHSHALPPREPFHHSAGIHRFPALTPTSLHCFVRTHRLQVVCPTPTHRRCCWRYVMGVNPVGKTAFFSKSNKILPQHPCHIRCINPANVKKNSLCHSFSQLCRLPCFRPLISCRYITDRPTPAAIHPRLASDFPPKGENGWTLYSCFLQRFTLDQYIEPHRNQGGSPPLFIFPRTWT